MQTSLVKDSDLSRLKEGLYEDQGGLVEEHLGDGAACDPSVLIYQEEAGLTSGIGADAPVSLTLVSLTSCPGGAAPFCLFLPSNVFPSFLQPCVCRCSYYPSPCTKQLLLPSAAAHPWASSSLHKRSQMLKDIP